MIALDKFEPMLELQSESVLNGYRNHTGNYSHVLIDAAPHYLHIQLEVEILNTGRRQELAGKAADALTVKAFGLPHASGYKNSQRMKRRIRTGYDVQ